MYSIISAPKLLFRLENLLILFKNANPKLHGDAASSFLTHKEYVFTFLCDSMFAIGAAIIPGFPLRLNVFRTTFDFCNMGDEKRFVCVFQR